jgi:hypothetical protein
LAPTVAAIALVVCVAVVAISAVRALADSASGPASSRRRRSPAVPVSAFSGRETGPVKVSFIEERREAVDDC